MSYSLGTLHNFILSLIISDPNNYKFFDRLTGPYWWAYWMMLNTTSALPLILLKNKFGRNLYLILLVGLLMNIGWIFESMVIHATSTHREYTTEYYYHYLPYSRERIILMKGLIVGLIALLIENIVKKWPVRNKE